MKTIYLKEYRKRSGLTQAELAEQMNVHENTIRRWEAGNFEPRSNDLQKLCRILGVTEAELLNGPANQELDVKIIMGVKSLTGLAGIELAGNNFVYGVNDNEPSIVLMGNVRIDTPEQRENALAEIISKFKTACWMYDHRDEATN